MPILTPSSSKTGNSLPRREVELLVAPRPALELGGEDGGDVGLAVGAEVAPGTIEHRGRVIAEFPAALADGEDERHRLLAREIEKRLQDRARQLEEVFGGILDQAVGEEGGQEELGKADHLHLLFGRLLDHAAGRNYSRPHVVREHGTRLGAATLSVLAMPTS